MTIRDIPPVDETAQNDETEPEGGKPVLQMNLRGCQLAR